ncbi:MAG: alpha/beta hydrolase [Ilumatobacteraceae bacterium]
MSTYLLIHGACGGGWCWDDLSSVLQAAGHRVIAPDLPCDDVDADLARYVAVACSAVTNAGQLESDGLIVVGHSLGSLTAAGVASSLPTTRLVFVAGVIGEPGLRLRDITDDDADRDFSLGDDGIELDDARRFRFTPECARRALYHDCTPAQADAAIARLRFQRSMYKDVAPFAAWPDTEITSIVCREDRIFSPDWSRRVARSRLGVEATEIDGGHSPMLSRPVELAALLT